jgi:ribosomal protein S18 acetylase RimI-like enzyme
MNEIKFVELDPDNKNHVEQIIEVEKEAFGINGGVDQWILKPIARYGKVYILIVGNEIIGIAEYIRNFSGEEVFLYGFSIKKEYRKKGYGKLLMNKCMEEFKKYKISKLSLTVDPKNLEAIYLYKKLGFNIRNLQKDEYGENIDRLYLVKNIN